MPVLGRRARRHRPSPGVAVAPRRTVLVELPRAPGAARRPAPLALPVSAARGPWALPREPGPLRELAAFLAAVDVAPPGAVLDVAAGAGEHALLAAVYSRRPIRAVEADAARAHAARQAAASNALAVVVEELRITGPAEGPGRRDREDGETLDGYVHRTALEPAVVRVGSEVDPAEVVGGGFGLLTRRRPWVLLASAEQAASILRRLPEMMALGYRLITEMDLERSSRGYVLAPEAVPAAFWRRLEAWSTALAATPLSPAAAADGVGPVPAPAVADLRGAEGASATS